MATFSLTRFLIEARRRRIFRVIGLYIVGVWVVLQVADLVFESWGVSSTALRHIWVGAILGFPVALILGWRYDIVGGRIVRTTVSNVDVDLSIGRSDYIILVALALVTVAIIFAVANKITITPVTEPESTAFIDIDPNSVAVLPFVNMSGNVDNEYFSDGLSETLLHMLAQVPELKVAARTSTFAFKNKEQDVRTIGDALNVAHILEGSVQRVGSRVRITAQLIRADDGFHVWSENYDRTLEDIFGIQDEIANQVSTALTSSLLGQSGSRKIVSVATDDVDAYDLYLRAIAEQHKASYESLQLSEGLLKNAIATDRNFHDAKTQLVSNYEVQLRTGLRTPENTFPEMIALLEQVLAARPDDVRARAWMLMARVGRANIVGEEVNFSDVINEMRALVAEAPNEVEPKQLLLRALTSLGEAEEAIALMQDLLALDPLNSWLLVEISQAYWAIEDWDNARAALDRSLELEPDQPHPYQMLAYVYLATGNAVEHVSNYLKAMQVDPQDHGYAARLAQFMYGLGLQQQGDRLRDRSIAIAPTSSHARNTELVRAARATNQATSLALARQMIKDDVDQHSGAWGHAAFVLFEMSEKQGASEDALAFVENQFPGFADYAQPVPFKVVQLRINALIAFYHTETFEELQQRLARLDYIEKELLTDGGGPILRMGALVLRGETEAAIDVALTEIFSKPAIVYIDVDRNFGLQFMADVTSDPRIQAALAHWTEDKARAAADVAAYLASLESF